MTIQNPFFSIILAVHRGPIYLPLSVSSVLSQALESFELFIVLDGAPQDTYDCARSLADSDGRIKVFQFSKGKRHGEEHRASALAEARGQVIAHIDDDCLWMPDNLQIIQKFCQKIDFGHTLQTAIKSDGRIFSPRSYLEQPAARKRMLRKNFNMIATSNVFYTRAAYESLPEKWAPAPANIATDLHMWRKFLREDLRFGTIFAGSSLVFPYPINFSDEASRNRIEQWLNKIQSAEELALVRERVMRIHATCLKERKQGKEHKLQWDNLARFFRDLFCRL